MERYNTTTAAAYLNVTPSRIRQLVMEGKLQGQKFGRDWEFTQKQLDACQQARRKYEKSV